jgi:teichoic acid transport system ATP-binding protein
MDEALTAGDIEFSEKAGEKLKDLISRSAMAFMVTHNLDFVENYCTRALWMDSGRVADMGTPSDVVSRYKSSHNFQAAKKNQPARLEKTSPSINSRSVAALANVGVRYRLAAGKRRKRDLWALSDIAMTIREGEILGIIGANGAGKTTLCRVLGGILHPDAGSIRVDGTTTALLSFGVGFNKQLTGRDNVYLNGMLMGLGRKTMDAVYEEIAEFSGLGRFMDEPLKNYSKGMRSRLGFSVISRIQPDIFIIDEALNAGDIRFYEKASRKIQELMQEAKATIVVTHNIKFIEKICTRTVWLHEGRIRFDGPPGEAVSRYRRYVREKKKNAAAGGAG